LKSNDVSLIAEDLKARSEENLQIIWPCVLHLTKIPKVPSAHERHVVLVDPDAYVLVAWHIRRTATGEQAEHQGDVWGLQGGHEVQPREPFQPQPSAPHRGQYTHASPAARALASVSRVCCDGCPPQALILYSSEVESGDYHKAEAWARMLRDRSLIRDDLRDILGNIGEYKWMIKSRVGLLHSCRCRVDQAPPSPRTTEGCMPTKEKLDAMVNGGWQSWPTSR
jgi:hypothetical protein